MPDAKDDPPPASGVRFATPTASARPPQPRRSTDCGAGGAAGRPSAGALPHSASRTDDAVLRARAREALAQLMEGHERFQQGALRRCRADPHTLADLLGAPCDPIAVVLACSDARVPPELIFDAGMGDLHVVRVAGPVLSSGGGPSGPSGRPPAGDVVTASVVEPLRGLGTRLVLVLGHTRCPAVAAAIAAYHGGGGGVCGGGSGTPSRRPSFSRRSPSPGRPGSLEAARAAAACPPPGTTAFAAAAAAMATKKPAPVAACGLGGWLRRTFSRKGSSGGVGGGGGAPPPPPPVAPGTDGGVDAPPALYRPSANPLAALTEGLAAAVDAVVRGVRGSHGAHPGPGGGRGSAGSDSEDGGAAAARAARGARLRTQDSLAIAHARLKKQESERCGSGKSSGGGVAPAGPPTAAPLSSPPLPPPPPGGGEAAAVDDVVAAHVKLTVSAVLRAVARALPPASAREVLVAGAVYDVDAGTARLLRVGWTSGRDFYYDRLESAD